MQVPVSITVNGRRHEREVEPRLLLVDFIRTCAGLTGTKIGCDTSQCGACTVLIDGMSAKSCTALAAQADGADVTTIEGLADGGKLHALQESFWNKHGLQCGFCTPGMILARARAAADERGAGRSRDPSRARRQPVPLHRLSEQSCAPCRMRPARRRTARDGETAMSSRIFGSGIRRREDPRLITGSATYTGDVTLPGMAHAAMLRSGHAHARIRRIDTSRAAAAPGVLAVYTGADVEGALQPMPCAWLLPDADLRVAAYPCIAKDVVRYTGDIVAAVVAETPYLAHDALDLIEVDYEPLPSVTDPEAARRPDAPQVHAADADGAAIAGNQAFHWVVAGGDVDAAFAAAAAGGVVIRERILQQRLIPNAMETRGAVAQYNRASGELTLWNTTQNPHIVRFLCSVVTGVPEDRLRVIAPEVGGGFGSKIAALPRRLRHGLLLEDAGAAGQVDREPQRELPGDDARPRSRPGRRAGGHEGRPHHRTAVHRPRRHGRLPVDRRSGHTDHPTTA